MFKKKKKTLDNMTESLKFYITGNPKGIEGSLKTLHNRIVGKCGENLYRHKNRKIVFKS